MKSFEITKRESGNSVSQQEHDTSTTHNVLKVTEETIDAQAQRLANAEGR